jgi:hypothetical protein
LEPEETEPESEQQQDFVGNYTVTIEEPEIIDTKVEPPYITIGMGREGIVQIDFSTEMNFPDNFANIVYEQRQYVYS